MYIVQPLIVCCYKLPVHPVVHDVVIFTWLEDFNRTVKRLATKDDLVAADADIILERFSKLRQAVLG